jgi:NAD(P)-dependent dehydrogenase (short-subunit alcohol dehydrogenase family)
MATAKRVAIVTGGGTGIGAAAARRLAALSCAVAVVGRRMEKLQETVSAIEEAGGQAIAIVEDMGDAGAPDRIVDVVVRTWGRIDVVVNNAAYIKHNKFDLFTAADFDNHFAVNVRGPFLLTQKALPYLRKSDNASVVNISSTSAALTIPGQACYATSKAALEYLTRIIAAELAPEGIRVNCISPGSTDTPIHLVWAADDLEGAYRRMKAEIPMRRMGTADELGYWIAALTVPEGSWITGEVWRIDGGQGLPGAASKIVAE